MRHARLLGIMCKDPLSVKILEPSSVKDLIYKNWKIVSGPYL